MRLVMTTGHDRSTT